MKKVFEIFSFEKNVRFQEKTIMLIKFLTRTYHTVLYLLFNNHIILFYLHFILKTHVQITSSCIRIFKTRFAFI